MNCQAYIPTKLTTSINTKQPVSFDSRLHLGFPQCKLQLAQHFHRCTHETPSTPGPPPALCSRPPSPHQVLSSAGLRLAWNDPRARHYIQAIFAIEATKPDAFLIGNADNLHFIEGGRAPGQVTNGPRASGYNVYDKIINTKHRGPRKTMQDTISLEFNESLATRFQTTRPVKQMQLHELLTPTHCDPGDPRCRPTSRVAAKHIDEATKVAHMTQKDDDWVIAKHCSTRYMTSPKPQWIFTALKP